MAIRVKEAALNAGVAIAAISAVAIVGLRFYERATSTRARVEEIHGVPDWKSFTRGGHRNGPSDAEATIVEFSDFQCGFCKMADETIADIQTKYPHDVAVVFRQFPLSFHKFAAAAAVASECAARQGQFEEFREALFSGQVSIGSKPWESYAAEAHVQDQRIFQQCLQDPSVGAVVQQDRIAGLRLGVEATPTLLINDTKVTGYPGSARLTMLVRLALDSAKKETTR